MNQHNSGPISQVGFLNVEHVGVQICNVLKHLTVQHKYSEGWVVTGLVEIHIIDIIDQSAAHP